MLFYALFSVDLASHSVALTTYETSSINRFHLASYVWLYYLTATVLDAFHIPPRQTLRFYLIVGIEPTVYFLKGNRPTIRLYQPTTMCCLSCFILFWNTKYNTPCTFCLADYSVMFHDICPYIAVKPLTINIAYTPLGATLRTIYTTLSHTNWQVGFVLRSAPPVTLCLPVLPLREHEQTFFPTHLLHCYIHPSYKWTLPRGSEQACIDEPLLAQSCRRILLWVSHDTYSKEAMPPNS